MKIFRKKGFTLIELLVVIAIIGIITGITFPSLSSARLKASDSKIKSQLKDINITAQIYYDSNGGVYSVIDLPDNDCGTTTPNTLLNEEKVSGALDTLPPQLTKKCSVTPSSHDAYAISVQLQSTGVDNDFWCVDNTGQSKLINITDPSAIDQTDSSCDLMDNK